MTSDNAQAATATTEATPAAATVQTFPAEYVQELRQEAASYRTKLREFEEAQKAESDKRLAEQNQWKILADQRAQEVESLRPFQEKYTAMLEALKAANEKRIGQIPDTMRSLIPPIDDPATLNQWLDTNWVLLTGKAPVPSLNGGAGSAQARTSSPALTDAELSMAAKMGVSAEDYAAAKITKGRK
jgi:hypothetical protein